MYYIDEMIRTFINVGIFMVFVTAITFLYFWFKDFFENKKRMKK